MGVLSEPVARRDWLLRRGVDQSWAWLLLGDPGDGTGRRPIDVSGWSGTLELRLADGTVAYTQTATRMTSDGLVWFDIPQTAFASPVWLGRPAGSYTVTAVMPDGRRIMVGDGHWTLC